MFYVFGKYRFDSFLSVESGFGLTWLVSTSYRTHAVYVCKRSPFSFNLFPPGAFCFFHLSNRFNSCRISESIWLVKVKVNDELATLKFNYLQERVSTHIFLITTRDNCLIFRIITQVFLCKLAIDLIMTGSFIWNYFPINKS